MLFSNINKFVCRFFFLSQVVNNNWFIQYRGLTSEYQILIKTRAFAAFPWEIFINQNFRLLKKSKPQLNIKEFHESTLQVCKRHHEICIQVLESLICILHFGGNIELYHQNTGIVYEYIVLYLIVWRIVIEKISFV